MMRISRTKLAAAAVTVLDRYSLVDVARILADYLIRERRVHEKDMLIKDMARILAERSSYCAVEVHTAHSLSRVARKQIESWISKRAGAQNVDMSFRVNPSLKGGSIIQTPDWEFNGSLQSILHNLF